MNSWFKKCFPEYSKENYAADEGSEDMRSEFGKIYLISTEHITPNRNQPRRNFDDEAIMSLADSIRRYGILQPLTVRSFGKGEYELVAGERRLRAAQMTGLEKVPCMIITASDERSATLAIIENIQRQDLNMFETAEALRLLIDRHGMTQDEIGRSLSMSQSNVANKLRILRLNKAERGLILENGLTERHARALLRIDGERERMTALKYIIGKKMSISAAEEYIESVCSVQPNRRRRKKRKLVLKDVRLFYNTVDRAIDVLHSAGIHIEKEEKETDDCTELIIRIPKPEKQEQTAGVRD